MLTQLSPPIPFYVVSKDDTGVAYAVIDYSPEHNLIWVIAMDKSGEIWSCPNSDVRAVKNYSVGREIKKSLMEAEPLLAAGYQYACSTI